MHIMDNSMGIITRPMICIGDTKEDHKGET